MTIIADVVEIITATIVVSSDGGGIVEITATTCVRSDFLLKREYASVE